MHVHVHTHACTHVLYILEYRCSLNLGVLLCLECSGIHRSLGARHTTCTCGTHTHTPACATDTARHATCAT